MLARDRGRHPLARQLVPPAAARQARKTAAKSRLDSKAKGKGTPQRKGKAEGKGEGRAAPTRVGLADEAMHGEASG